MTSTSRIQHSETENFYAELADLKQRFENMKPEFEATVRDPAMGVEGYVVVWNMAISKGGPLEGSGKGGTRVTPNELYSPVSIG